MVNALICSKFSSCKCVFSLAAWFCGQVHPFGDSYWWCHFFFNIYFKCRSEKEPPSTLMWTLFLLAQVSHLYFCSFCYPFLFFCWDIFFFCLEFLFWSSITIEGDNMKSLFLKLMRPLRTPQLRLIYTLARLVRILNGTFYICKCFIDLVLWLFVLIYSYDFFSLFNFIT